MITFYDIYHMTRQNPARAFFYVLLGACLACIVYSLSV